MIFFKRRRLVFWLIKAYFKKWRRSLFLSFIFGLVVFFILRFGVNYFVPIIPFTQKQTIGIVGSYTTDNIPISILSKISYGLTSVSQDQSIAPAAAKSWDIKDDGKTYIFYLKDNIHFTDGTLLTSDKINYNFLDVSVEKPNKSTIIFKLKNKYSPFLVTVSRPIFKNDFEGIGNFKMQDINLNGNFIQSINLVDAKGKNKEMSYQFYPTEDALKSAYALGDISKMVGISSTTFNGKDFSNFKNSNISKNVNYSKLMTVFYNTQDKNLSDKRLREALSYAMPDLFSKGERSYGPFPPSSWVYENGRTTYIQDVLHAKSIIDQSVGASPSSKLIIELKTLPQNESLAKGIKSYWKKIGVETNIIIVNSFPQTFQAFLGEFNIPRDPDQYTIWHSSQTNNITNYKNLRIDKLLEDGRQTSDLTERRKIYSDFQKYFIDDSPATFLYFPEEFTITRK